MRARSADGRRFEFVSPVSSAPAVGTYVTIDTGDGAWLGQVLDIAFVDDAGGATALLRGEGRLRGFRREGRPAEGPPVFADAPVEPADADLVQRHLAEGLGSAATIGLGTLQAMPRVPASLRSAGFGRHTFVCGQSGSGKTYTLGILLEQLLLETDLSMVVLDPNADYVRMDTLRPQAAIGLDDDDYRRLAERYGRLRERVHVAGGPDSAMPFRARFGKLSLRQQSMVLGLDPIRDAEEYNAFVRTVRSFDGGDYGIEDLMAAVRQSFDTGMRRLGMRIDNLDLVDQPIWARRGHEPILASLHPNWRMLVVDLGSLGGPGPSAIAAAGVLGHLWDQRQERQPTLIVIDEAHNICPRQPADANQALATEHMIRIAGEGRKYGLFLVLSTQRPSKVHEQVLTQCDNLVLMRMNSVADTEAMAETFSFAPAGLVRRAGSFELGEGLVAGKIAPDPMLFRSGTRLSVESGADVSSDWSRPR